MNGHDARSIVGTMAARIPTDTKLSNTHMDKAGARIRAWLIDPAQTPQDVVTDPALRQAWLDVFTWRDTFRAPLSKVVMGLRSFVKSERPELRATGAKLPVGQRLKRRPQIVTKLWRYPTMKLSRMQDVGDCRAILPGGAPEVQRILARIHERWDVVDLHDYTERPGPTGYRAVHAIVKRDDRRIEIQLRTPRQHEWAEVIERTDLRLRTHLKAGLGEPDLLRYFELASRGLALEEAGEATDVGFEEELAELRERVRHHFREPGA